MPHTPEWRALWQDLWRAWLPWAALVLAIVAGAATYSRHTHHEQHTARLVAVADLRAAQVGQWLQERKAHARFASTSPLWADLFKRWQTTRDIASRDQLHSRMLEMRNAFGDQGVALLDAQGRWVLEDATNGPQPVSPALKAAVLRASISGEVTHTGFYALPGQPDEQVLDIVAPLRNTGSPAQAAVAFRLKFDEALKPQIKAWPVSTRSGTTVLVRREGDGIVGTNLTTPLPISSPDLLVAKVLRGEAPLGTPIEGLGSHGEPSIGVVQTVPDTDWMLVARIDRSEVLASALPDMLWILGGGLVGLLACGVALYDLHERRQLQLALQRQALHQERLRGLSLMQAIADSSPDAIFAKDLDGAYLLCNQQAARLFNQPVDAILGRDDLALQPEALARASQAIDRRVLAEQRFITIEDQLPLADGTITLLTLKGPLRDAQGKVIGLFGIGRDITERKRQELALKHAAELVQAVEDSVLDQMAVLDTQGNIVAVNAAWRAVGAVGGLYAVSCGTRGIQLTAAAGLNG